MESRCRQPTLSLVVSRRLASCRRNRAFRPSLPPSIHMINGRISQRDSVQSQNSNPPQSQPLFPGLARTSELWTTALLATFPFAQPADHCWSQQPMSLPALPAQARAEAGSGRRSRNTATPSISPGREPAAFLHWEQLRLVPPFFNNHAQTYSLSDPAQQMAVNALGKAVQGPWRPGKIPAHRTPLKLKV